MRCLISWLFFNYPCVVRGDWRDLLDLLLFQRLLSLGPPPLLFCLLLPPFAPCLRSLAGLCFFCLLSGFALCLCSFSSFGLLSRLLCFRLFALLLCCAFTLVCSYGVGLVLARSVGDRWRAGQPQSKFRIGSAIAEKRCWCALCH